MLYGPEQSQRSWTWGWQEMSLLWPHIFSSWTWLFEHLWEELPSTACLIPSRVSGQYVMPNSSVNPPSAFSPYQNFSGVGFFFWCHFFPPFCLTLISWEARMSPQIKFLSWVVCVALVAGHRNNILGLFEILVSGLLLPVSVSDSLAAGRSWPVCGYRPWREQGWDGRGSPAILSIFILPFLGVFFDEPCLHFLLLHFLIISNLTL